MNKNAVSSLLALGIFVVVFYMFKTPLMALFSGNTVGNTIRGYPALGVPTALGPVVPVNFALTAATGDQYSTPPPGYVRNSTGGLTAVPDSNGIGGGFAT